MGIWSHSLPSGLFLTACWTAVGLCPGQSCEVRLLKPFFPTVNTPKQLLNRKAGFIRTDARTGDFLGRKLKMREIKTRQHIIISPPCLLCPGKSIFAKACSQSRTSMICREICTVPFGSLRKVLLKLGFLLFSADIWSLLYVGLIPWPPSLLRNLFVLYVLESYSL